MNRSPTGENSAAVLARSKGAAYIPPVRGQKRRLPCDHLRFRSSLTPQLVARLIKTRSRSRTSSTCSKSTNESASVLGGERGGTTWPFSL